MRTFAENMNTTLQLSSPYHHNTNGQVERQFRTIRELISATMKERKTSDWVEILPEVEFSINATVQKAIGRSPAEVVFGRKISRERWMPTRPRTEIAREATRREFAVGEDVLVKREVRKKDEDKYEGPFQITKRIHERRYMLRNNEGKEIERNVEKIKKFLKEGDVRGK